MNYTYPYFGFPNYYGNLNNINSSKNTNLDNFPPHYSPNNKQAYSYKNTTFNSNSLNNYNNNFKKDNNNEKIKKETKQSPFLTLFGISLYFDDILLICVILFLYSEDIDDSYLMLVLLLLLMS